MGPGILTTLCQDLIVGIEMNAIGFKIEVKRLMGVEVHQDGDKRSCFSGVMECSGLKATINLMVMLEGSILETT